MEEWKKIDGFEDYEVSNLGRIRSIRKNKILKTHIKNGYEYIGLYKNKVHVIVRVHRIVAKEFILNPENKPAVNHINGNKLDNRVINLEWVTNSENMIHAFQNELHKPVDKKITSENGKKLWENYGKAYIESIKIKANQYDKNHKLIGTWESAEEAQRVLHIFHVAEAIKGKRKTAGGFIWEKAKSDNERS